MTQEILWPLRGVSKDANNLITLGSDGQVFASLATTDDRWVNVSGDWMSGPLTLGGTAKFTATAPLDIDATTFRVRQPSTPTSQTSPGEQGTVCWDTAYLYACIAPNQWRRIAWRDWDGVVTGGSWAPINTSAPSLYTLTHANNMFLADAAKWSTDGSNWFSGTPLSGHNYTRAAFGNGTYVKARLLGSSNTAEFYTSSDGKAWTTRPYNHGVTSFRNPERSLSFGGSRFVALMNTSGSTNGNVLPRYSVDGITWLTSAAPTSLAASTLSDVQGIAFSGGLFVAVGWASSAGNPTNRYITSPDGVTWTARSLPISAKWNDVVFANGRYVCIAPGLAAMTSVDGVNWAQVNMPSSADWESLAYGGNRWIAVASSTSTAAQSTDGVTWTTMSLPSASAWNSIATNGTVFVAANGTNSPALFSATPQLVTYFPISASRDLVSSDANATIANVSTDPAPVTVTVPADATLGFPIGTSINIMDASQSAVTTIRASAGVTLNWSGKLVGTSASLLGGVGVEVQIPGPLSQVVLRKVAVNTWTIIY